MADAPKPKPERTLPDAAICRGESIGSTDLVDCLVPSPVECRYALPFGNGYFCQHPDRKGIVARTKP
jgi:hypothetical protein